MLTLKSKRTISCNPRGTGKLLFRDGENFPLCLKRDMLAGTLRYQQSGHNWTNARQTRKHLADFKHKTKFKEFHQKNKLTAESEVILTN